MPVSRGPTKLDVNTTGNETATEGPQMSSRSSIIASISSGIVGASLTAFGAMPLLAGNALMVQGSLAAGDVIEFPNLAPLISVIVGIVLLVVGVLLFALRGRRDEVPLAARALANAPLIVAREGDDVTFIWADTRGASRRRGTSRAALTHA